MLTLLAYFVLGTLAVVRKARDGLFLLHELKYLLGIFLFYGIITGASSPIDRRLDAAGVEFEVTKTLKFLCLQCIIATMVWFPIYKSYFPNGATSDIEMRLQRLQNVKFIAFLTDGKYAAERSSFEKHLAKEFSVENLVFFDRVGEFKKMCEDEHEHGEEFIARQAWRLYREFLARDSSMEVH